MTFRTLVGAGLSALLLTGTVGLVAHAVQPAVAGGRVDAKSERKAADLAARAQKALARKDWDKAIDFAEGAVEANGDDAGYRQLLGNAYLRAGRFQSASQAFGDVMTLQPANGQAALNRALAEIALGRWAEARALLDDHAATMPTADRGLALALAGDPTRAVEVLTEATRTAGADAKTRQNLALAMALAGRWAEARVLIGIDMTPTDADQRIVQWASFARPATASDQVSSLLGITPVEDAGQPLAIALSGAVRPDQQVSDVDAFMAGQPTMGETEVGGVEASAPKSASATFEVKRAPVFVPVAKYDMPAVSVDVPPAQPAPKQSLVDLYLARHGAAPAMASGPKLLTARGDYKQAVAVKAPLIVRTATTTTTAARPVAKGSWYVQIGAYRNSAVSRDGWRSATKRLPAMAGYTPAEMTATVNGATYRRLSVGGFDRAGAMSLCQRYRAQGGMCFVRAGAGDQVAAWHKPAAARVQLASR